MVVCESDQRGEYGLFGFKTSACSLHSCYRQPTGQAFYLKIPDGVYHGLGFQVEHGEPVHMNSSGGWAGS